MAAQGWTVSKISRETKLHHRTVTRILQDPAIVAEKENIEERLADKFEELTERILNSVCDADLEKASLQQKSISAATMLDKARLIRGRSTSNLAVFLASAVMSADLDPGE